jgi:DNA (cytosine-5)-methyltransferase 1
LKSDGNNVASVKRKEVPTGLSVVSLFSGCGGLDLGFEGGFEVFGQQYERLPFNITWANDLNPAACRSYKKNLADRIHCGDVWGALDSMPQHADVVIGGFPCQDLSINGLKKGVAGGRSGLYRAMVEAVKRLKPKAFVAENVRGLLLEYNKDSLEQVLGDFTALGYEVQVKLYLAADYGVPQMRQRVFIVGTLPGVKMFQPPAPVRSREEWMTAEDAVSDLEQMEENPAFSHTWSRAAVSGEQGNRTLKSDRPADTMRAECHGNIQFHYKLPRRISMREAARFQSFPDTFIFDAKLRETERQIGNAVPPVMGWHIAKALCECLQ